MSPSATQDCLACVLSGGPGQPNKRDAWRRVCEQCTGEECLVPGPRVRLCAERVGTWGSTCGIWQRWDTGEGAVINASKFQLAPKPDGNVAIVFETESDAKVSHRST